MRLLARLLPAAAAALVLAAPAEAGYSSARLSVVNTAKTVGAGGSVTLGFSQAALDDPTARIVTYVPRGYVSSLVPRAGDALGTARATVVVEGRRVTAAGSVVAADPDRHRAQAEACAGATARVDAVYVVELAEGGRRVLELPIFVRTVTSGREAAFASGALTTCFPAPAAPDAATARPRVLALSLAFRRLLASPATAGVYRWRSLWTPYREGKRAVDAAVEAQALDLLPVQLTLVTGRFQRRTRSVFVGGALLENRRALPGGSIQLLAGPTAARLGRLAVTRTNANGNYGGRLKLKAGTWYLRARATVRSRTRNGCAVETVAAVPCLRTTTSGFTHTSAVVRLVVPR